ncbi:MAG: hypothetical protein ACYDCG_02895 [Candidatus Acidiferrales bacterium]
MRNWETERFVYTNFDCPSISGSISVDPTTQSQPRAPTPAESHTEKANEGKVDQDKESRDDQIGKGKREKETGTVNDRIFEVLPNYGTVETANLLPSLTSLQKFRLATAGVFDCAAYPCNGALAAIAQTKNDPPTWGQG